MLEIAMSEFHIGRVEYLFEWGLPDFMDLLNTRIARNKAITDKPAAVAPPANQYSDIRLLSMLG